MTAACKFCGQTLNGRGEWAACPTCGAYCRNKCPLASSGVTWHTPPCITCEHNPYRQRHTWDGQRWVRK